MKKGAIAFMALTMAVLAISGCDKTEPKEPEGPSTIKVTGVSLDLQSLSMTEGESSTLTATVAPSNATDKSVTWSSNTTAVATVDDNGKVIAVKAGEATITVTTKDGGKTATCKVTVKAKEIPATGLKIEPSSITFVEGQTKSYKATVTPSNSTDEVIWWNKGFLLKSNGGDRTRRQNLATEVPPLPASISMSKPVP